ncbi:DUF1090 domain-containing protein [Acinetobacter larvae]|uniref:DUF1090 domain-containing protein n=1 Tax=Acinetobacter larvae TaxID=1789224 RepID=A0A1B2M1X5_9GAMM|nr:DUF1090 domain-containing protein [Acinetobacter larvae]AOA59200.1 hypothetical protein BFG52_13105 [Acinetobacter larvae]
MLQVKQGLCIVLGCVLSSPLWAAQSCQEKRQNIQTQITYAQQHGNSQRLAGLQRALSQVEQHCTDQQLQQDQADQVAKLQAKQQEKQAEITKLQGNIDKARSKGDFNKVGKYQRKIRDKQFEIQKLQQQIDQL